ncbi:pseudouridine synthase [Larsenimonas rhizosphaerae]|uniref:pseudouridine synthase n=1 Tax=Larsenimonas rhizosphaerae TaxID=2944682 RepID=UPI00203422F0|nr:pseudouridine synthase [Larsenimonas rhizosphaerae]MCM2130050.1 pseudouridine synthase [Larsenimonas rhizosphaerae]
MSISKRASRLSLPQINPGVSTVLEYLLLRFPAIGEATWRERMATGKVHRDDGVLITPTSPFKPQLRVFYYREVASEPSIPFAEQIVYRDEHILVAYKPHFLPVMPGGRYVTECLQQRLRNSTGIEALQAVHRLDRVTAGLVLCSLNPETRGQYHQLFKSRRIHKTYQAIAEVEGHESWVGREWDVKNRIEKNEQRFRMRVSEGDANSHSVIRCVQQTDTQALFELHPVSGRRHQLRVHMQSLGWPILNDRYYPVLQPLSPDDYTRPLQLLSKGLEFIDPVTSEPRRIEYDGNLALE